MHCAQSCSIIEAEVKVSKKIAFYLILVCTVFLCNLSGNHHSIVYTTPSQCTIYERTFLILLQECNKCTVSLLHTWLMIEFPVWKNKCSVLFTQVSPEIQHLVGGIPFFLFDWNQRLQISLANKSCNSWDKSHHRLRRDEQSFSFTKNIVFFYFFAAGSWEKDTQNGAAVTSLSMFLRGRAKWWIMSYFWPLLFQLCMGKKSFFLGLAVLTNIVSKK